MSRLIHQIDPRTFTKQRSDISQKPQTDNTNNQTNDINQNVDINNNNTNNQTNDINQNGEINNNDELNK
jgi:hypothetical protein